LAPSKSILLPERVWVLVPDLLGFGESAKPLDVEAYKGRNMANDVIENLDHENIPQVIGTGHDWYLTYLSLSVSSTVSA